MTLILTGLVLSFYTGSVNQIFSIFNHDQLMNMFLWSTGALNQMDGHNVAMLWPRLLLAFVVALLRPLTLMGLDDGVKILVRHCQRRISVRWHWRFCSVRSW